MRIGAYYTLLKKNKNNRPKYKKAVIFMFILIFIKLLKLISFYEIVCNICQ